MPNRHLVFADGEDIGHSAVAGAVGCIALVAHEHSLNFNQWWRFGIRHGEFICQRMPESAVDITVGKGGPTRQVRTILDVHRTHKCLVPRDDDVAVGQLKGDVL